jgi:catechol 2,3-dioxygenase
VSARAQDLFGGSVAEPATPGSYGEPPAGYRLPDATRLGPVQLQVSALVRSLPYYEGVLGLAVLERGDGRAVLGSHGDARPLVVLREHAAAARSKPQGRLGLYHYAILLPDRAALGRFVEHVGRTGERVGAGDHLVSEAFYLHDPDGLGIEVYADRPRSAWRRRGRELMLATDPVDVEGVLAAAGGEPWTGMPAGTVMGHVHLHVGDLAAAEAFYSQGLGLDRITWSYPGALFLGAGGYHHHLGANTWAGPAARPPGPDDPRLLEWTIELPSPADVSAVEESLTTAGHVIELASTETLVARDPWGTGVRIVAASAPDARG